MPTISAINYRKVVVTEEVSEWTLSPFDAAGRPLQSMTVEVDVTLGNATLLLPSIANFGGIFNTKIIVNSVGSEPVNNNITVTCQEGDSIGNSGSVEIVYSGNAVFTPVTSNEWSVVLTQGAVPA